MSQVQHILIRPESDSEADRATAKSRLQEIKERIDEGAEFADEAAAHSDCPSGKRSGGNLGWLTKGMMVPAVDKVIFELKESEISEILETDLGFHIMRKTGHEKGGPAAYPEVAETIRDFLRHARRGTVLSAYVEDLKKKAVIEDD
jgi:parvulin-like peptidyl-prolyl isomerase